MALCGGVEGLDAICVMTDYKHDLAFSLLDIDEPLARKIRRFIPEALSVFLYSERQAEAIGNDGVELFSGVFGRESRVVVILHRRNWGETKWTRLEAEAIKTRLWNEGPDFVTLVKLTDDPAPPWLPPNRIWVDFERLRIRGLAGALIERVNARGKETRQETASELSERYLRAKREAAARLAFLHSDEGLQSANRSADALFKAFERIGLGIHGSVSRGHWQILLFHDGFAVSIGWAVSSFGDLRDSELCVKEWKGRPNIGGLFAGGSKELATHLFDFDQPHPGDTGWRNRNTRQVFSSDQLAEWAGKLLIHRIWPEE